MSFFGKIGKAIKKGVHDVGGLAEKAAPFVGMIPGIGTLAGGAIGGLGALAHGDGLGGALKYGAAGAASGFGGSKLLGLASKAGGALTAPGSPGSGVLSTIAGGAKGAIDAAGSHGISIGDILKGGLTAAGGISGLVSAHKAGTAMDRAYGSQAGIADSLNTRGGAMADAASKGLLARLAAGPRATPDFSRFVDRANPFSGQFAPPPVAPTPSPALAQPAPQLALNSGVIPPRRRLPPPPMAVAQ